MGGLPGIGSGTNKKVVDYKLASDTVGIESYVIGADSSLFRLKNNNYDTVTVSEFRVNQQENLTCNSSNTNPALPIVLNVGESKLINCSVVNSSSYTITNRQTPTVGILYTDSLGAERTAGNVESYGNVSSGGSQEEEEVEVDSCLGSYVNISSCQEISSPGCYLLQNDIVGNESEPYCLRIIADNVTLNGNNKSVTLTPPMGDPWELGWEYATCIYAEGRNNITVRNFGLLTPTFWGGVYNAGVFFNGVDNSKIQDIIFGEVDNVIELRDSNNNLVENLRAVGYIIDRAGIEQTGSSNDNNVFRNISISLGNAYWGIGVMGNNQLFEDIEIIGFGTGMNVIAPSSNNTFRNVRLDGSGYWWGSAGVYLMDTNSENLFYNLDVYNYAGYEISSGGWDWNHRNHLIYNNSYGQITFSELNADIEGDIRFGEGRSIEISQNLVRMDTSVSGFNKSANVTLLNTGISSNAQVLRNGVACGGVCSGLTNIGGSSWSFSVTGWSNYSIGSN